MAEFPVIPGYKIKKKLGQGGMADVYLGVRENLSRIVAIKVLNLDIFRNPRLSKRFVKEARLLSLLTHPNIVAVSDVGQVNRYHYIVMEYLQEGLSERIKKNRVIPPPEALHIMLQVADALFYAHGKGYIHRDIKPDNIMFRQDGTPVVLDFGIARAVDSKTKLTRTGMSVGTPQYMSPEQCNAETLDGRSDIYSLGVVLFEMLTGKPPYSADDTIGIVMKHLKEPVPLLPTGLKEYQLIIDAMMAKEKKKRIRSKDRLLGIVKPLLSRETGTKTQIKNVNQGIGKGVAKKTRRKDNAAGTRVTVVTGRIRTPRTSSSSQSSQEDSHSGKAINYSRVFLIVLFIIFVVIVVQGQFFPELIIAVRKLFKVIGSFLF
jgi:serine/threonine-protein kinase PpkA